MQTLSYKGPITFKGQELTFEFMPTVSMGYRLAVWKWDTETKDFLKVSECAYPLYTQFEILCTVASELGGETIDGEELAEKLGIPMRTSDDVSCIKCETWDHYDSEFMVHGTDALPEKADALGLTNWDYVCLECYLAVPGGEN
jgi:hypothetical protein